MQQSPSLLVLSIRSAFRASRVSRRVPSPVSQRVIQNTSPQPRLWMQCQLSTRHPFHSSRKWLADDLNTKQDPVQHRGIQKSSTSGATKSEDTEESSIPIPRSSTSASQKDDGPLPSHQESRRSQISKRFTSLMDNLQSNIFVASQHINDLTGYSGIEALKREIEILETQVQNTRRAVREARDRYTEAITIRSSSQREVNDLLQRKHAWSPADLERFTSLYRSDHVNEQAEAKAQENLSRAEREAEEAASKLARTILARYHEEQIWSDKIRRMSTWGTWGLMGLNVFLFLIFQVAVEPWRRQRLVRGFEEKVLEALEKENSVHTTDSSIASTMVATESAPTESQDETRILSEPATSAPSPNTGKPIEPILTTVDLVQEEPTPLQDLASVVPEMNPSATNPPTHRLSSFRQSIYTHYVFTKDSIFDLFSTQTKVTVSKREFSTAVLEGFVGGAAIAGVLAVFIVKGR